MRDLDQVRGFLSGSGPLALFDMPWMPLYLGICFLFHPLIGWTALAGALVLLSLTLLTELLSRRHAKLSFSASCVRQTRAEASRRNAEVIEAMGMLPQVLSAWSEADRDFLVRQHRASDVTGGFGAISKVLRLGLQSAIVGVGAYLVIRGEATAGVILSNHFGIRSRGLGARSSARNSLAALPVGVLSATRPGPKPLRDQIARAWREE